MDIAQNLQDELLMKYSYMMSYWNAPIDITYPTPPYISLREDVGLIQNPPPLPRRKFLDMIRKFNLNDIQLITFEYGVTHGVAGNEIYNKVGKELQTSIRDKDNKWIVCDKEQLKAMFLQIPHIGNKASFKIFYYMPIVNGKKPITLKVGSQYLSCRSGNLTLESTNDEYLNTINSSNEQFLFFQSDSSNVLHLIEPATAPQSIVCTSKQDDCPVTVQPASTNTVVTDFVFEGELYGSLLIVGQKRISLEPLKREMY